jgi:pimeloyl-ACP methyl ester carboxylesterase
MQYVCYVRKQSKERGRIVTDQRKELQLPQGTIRYREAGTGKPIVFVHGYLVDSRLWDGVVDRLSDRFRCIAPDWPIAAHQVAMNPDADLSPPGIARLIADFLTKLELEDVTIVANDSGGAMSQVLVTSHPDRIGRLVLTNCDTHENFPPGMFKAMPPLAKLPGGMRILSAPFRIEAVARRAFAPFAKTKIPDDLIASWMEPAKRDSKIMRDAGKVTAGMNKRHTLAAAEKLRGSQLPILLAWAPGDKYFPISYAERLAGEAGNAKLVRIPDAKTFVALDQPARLAEEIAEFAASA